LTTSKEDFPFHTFLHVEKNIFLFPRPLVGILYVMKLLGHRSISNTLAYTQLVASKNNEYTSKVATNTDEACKLVEAGFEHAC